MTECEVTIALTRIYIRSKEHETGASSLSTVLSIFGFATSLPNVSFISSCALKYRTRNTSKSDIHNPNAYARTSLAGSAKWPQKKQRANRISKPSQQNTTLSWHVINTIQHRPTARQHNYFDYRKQWGFHGRFLKGEVAKFRIRKTTKLSPWGRDSKLFSIWAPMLVHCEPLNPDCESVRI